MQCNTATSASIKPPQQGIVPLCGIDFTQLPGQPSFVNASDLVEHELLEERTRTLHAQQEELRKFKFFSDHSTDEHLLVDEARRLRYANKRACERLGYDEAMLRPTFATLGIALRLLFGVHRACRSFRESCRRRPLGSVGVYRFFGKADVVVSGLL